MKQWMVGLLMLGLAGGVANGEDSNGEAEARIALSTQDGSSLIGTPLARGVRVETSFGRSAIPFQVMTRARLDETGGGVVIEFRNQDRLTGTCLEKWIGVNTAFGVQKVPLDFIREIRVLSPVRADGLLAYYPFDGDADGQVRDAGGTGGRWVRCSCRRVSAAGRSRWGVEPDISRFLTIRHGISLTGPLRLHCG